MFVTGYIDPRPAATRLDLNRRTIRDLGESSRWSLHLSEGELAWLEAHNPDTLGHHDEKLRAGYWKKFMAHPDSKPYRVQGV